MIESFVDSWEIFCFSHLTGWVTAVLLALVGVYVVARDQIFVGAAVSQASTLGIAVALALAGWGVVPEHVAPWDTLPAILAVVFSVLAALFSGREGGLGGESHEAVSGWVFLATASLSVLLMAHSPHGLEEIHKLLFSSIIVVRELDFWIVTGLTVGTIALLILYGRPLLLFTMDPAMAAAVGMCTGRWSVLASAWLGLTLGITLKLSGLLYSFGCLVLPALIARHLVREMRSMYLVSPLVALLTAVAGFVIANHQDYPPGQLTVALFAALLGILWTFRKLLSRVTS